MPSGPGTYPMGGGKTYTRAGLNTAAAAGGQRGSVSPTNLSKPNQKFLGGNADKFLQSYGGIAQAIADPARRDFQRTVGTMLGNLNSIGALRSGAVQSNVNELTDTFSRGIGEQTALHSGRVLGMAQEEHDLESERGFRERQYRDAQKASKRRGIGRLLGGAAGGLIGLATAGPAGALGGAKTGSNLFG